MRKPLLLLILAALAAGFAPVPFPRPERRRTDQERMQGTWVLKAMTIDGREMKGRENVRVVIDGRRLKYVNGGQVTIEYDLTLDPTRSPGWYVSRQVSA